MTNETQLEYKQRRNSSVLNSFSSSARTINGIVNNTHNSMQEHIFTEGILKDLRGWIQGKDVPIGHWLNAAGGLYQEIKVVDSYTGELLFYTPSPFVKIPPVSIRTDLPLNQRVTLHQVIERQKLAAKNGDARMEAAIEQQIPEMFEFDKSGDIFYNYLIKIYYIYKRYNLPMGELFPDRTDEWVEMCENKIKEANELDNPEVYDEEIEEETTSIMDVDDYEF